MVVFVLSISFVSLIGTSALLVSVIGTTETEVGLLADLPYLNLNCSSKIIDLTNICSDEGKEIFSRGP